VLIGIVLTWTIGDVPDPHADEVAWALESDGALGFGGWWFVYVSRPIFLALLLAWLWRLVLVVILFARIGRLELSLVPTHPDRVGGLGFVQGLPAAFAPVSLALSTAISSHWAHGLLYHDLSIQAIRAPALVFVAIVAMAMLLPLLMLLPALFAAKRQALPAYAALVGEHGRLVHRRWIEHEPVADPSLLEAAELGPIADTAAIYEAVSAMRPFPIGRRALISILVPLVVPMLVVVCLQIPLKEVLLKLLKALV